MGKLEGKVAAVTGGAGGIGSVVARRFAEEGAAVAVMDLDGAAAGTHAAALAEAGHRATGVAIDVGDDSSVDGAFRKATEALGEIDILAHFAAIAGSGAMVEAMSVDAFDEMVRVNLRGTFLCTRMVLPAMRRKRSGRIITVASEVAYRGNAGLAHYAATKAAVTAFTKCLAHEAAPDGVLVNTLAPGPTDTAMLAGVEPAIIEHLTKDLMPIGRLGRPEEIAAAALFLASDDGGFCVGTTLNVNGGAYMP